MMRRKGSEKAVKGEGKCSAKARKGCGTAVGMSREKTVATHVWRAEGPMFATQWAMDATQDGKNRRSNGEWRKAV